MKSLYLFPLFCLCLLLSCSGNNNDVVITGNLTGVEDGTVLSLSRMEGTSGVTLLRDTLTNGSFRFEFIDSTDVARSYQILAIGEGIPLMLLDVWVKPGARIKITGKDKLIRTWDVQSNVPEQKELNKYKEKNKDYETRYQIIEVEQRVLSAEKTKFPDRQNEIQSKINLLRTESDSLYRLILQNELDMMEANPTYSTFWIDKFNKNSLIARYYPNYLDKDRLITMYNRLSEDFKNSQLGQDIYFNLFPPTVVKVGEEMADADMYDIDGNLRRLADYKGKYILLDFWSRGCGPCIAAIPEMKEIAEKYKDKLVVVSISSDTKEMWEEASQKEGVTWPNFNEFKGTNGLFARYGVVGIPNYFLITPDGIINSSWMGYGKGTLLAKMEELVK